MCDVRAPLCRRGTSRARATGAQERTRRVDRSAAHNCESIHARIAHRARADARSAHCSASTRPPRLSPAHRFASVAVGPRGSTAQSASVGTAARRSSRPASASNVCGSRCRRAECTFAISFDEVAAVERDDATASNGTTASGAASACGAAPGAAGGGFLCSSPCARALILRRSVCGLSRAGRGEKRANAAHHHATTVNTPHK
jgi:hypothetical protein